MIYTYVKFELNMCNLYQENDRKLMMAEWQKEKGAEGRAG
jgi:hypothetical protein